jgi:restriction endonuclease Mrr
MHAVVRTFSGAGAKQLFDLLETKKAEVEAVLRKVKGFTGYTLMRTGDGGLSVTVCKDKAGTDESVVVARDWVKKNASGTGVAPPTVTEGSVILHLK